MEGIGRDTVRIRVIRRAAGVVVIETASPRAMMRALPKVYDGGHIELKQVTVLRGAKVGVRPASLRVLS